MRMASACALTMAGMPTPASTAEPAAPLIRLRRESFEVMGRSSLEVCQAGGLGAAPGPNQVRACCHCCCTNTVARDIFLVQRVFVPHGECHLAGFLVPRASRRVSRMALAGQYVRI